MYEARRDVPVRALEHRASHAVATRAGAARRVLAVSECLDFDHYISSSCDA